MSTDASRAADPTPDPFAPFLSVVIPAYNEEHRLPRTLETVAAYLRSRPYPCELLVVDDGSDDSTCDTAEQVISTQRLNEGNLRTQVIHNPHQGKGYTVRTGMLAAQGEYVLFSDADLSTPIEDLEKLLPWLTLGGKRQGRYDVAIGSREGAGAVRYDEPFYRHLMGRVFNLAVRLLAIGRIQDTQCGFKMFSREAAHDLFSRLQLYGVNSGPVKGAMVTAFDVEVLYLAGKRGYKVREVPVEWRHFEGSKVNPIKDSIRNFSDILKVRLNDIRGKYN